ncbi:hypothetical protein Q3G72_003073 [Acer saccharum]|nr:hypothetical protein Q3G72_003073 [Acer saccharum]
MTPKTQEDVWLVRQLKNSNGGWNRPLNEALFVEDDAKVIYSIPYNSNHSDDSICWHYTASRVYTVKSGVANGNSEDRSGHFIQDSIKWKPPDEGF